MAFHDAQTPEDLPVYCRPGSIGDFDIEEDDDAIEDEDDDAIEDEDDDGEDSPVVESCKVL